MRIHELLNEGRVVLDREREMVAWKNPSKAELRRLLAKFGQLRGGAQPGEDLWVWDANTWVHGTIYKYVGHHCYYLYISTTQRVDAEEWQAEMQPYKDIFVGAKFEQDDEFRPDIVLADPNVKRALG
jgi:hypothetical protein